MDKTSPSSFVHQDLWIIVQLLLMKSYFGFVHIEAYQYYLTYRFGVSQRAVILSSGASVLRCCSCRPFYFPSFSKWYCTVRWHIFFYMYHFKCIVYIVFKDEIRLNEWMPWSLWFAFAAETELCVQEARGSTKYWVSVWCVRPWLLESLEENKTLFTWPPKSRDAL